MKREITDFLTQAIDTAYRDLKLEHYSFDEATEAYDIQLTHTKSNKMIRIGFKDTAKKRDFDVIPIHSINAPLGLIEIFTTFLKVYWHAQENKQTIVESLATLVSDELEDLGLIDEEKLVQ